ncbi:MAG: helix-turn-helix transcriptional regulator [Pseudomonadota bacterium]|nr:helix-turn-helix transcriptional regulator [Pseudomonadota bacterium]
MSKNNIAYLRRRRNFTQKRLADMIGIPPSTLNRIETGETEGFEKYRALLAKALGCKPENLDDPDFQMPSVLVTGIVKYKTFIKDVAKKDAEHVEAIPGLPSTTEALEIKTSDLINYHGSNDLLYFDSVPQENERLFLDRECVVQLDTKKRGGKLLAWITKGSGEGKYILHAHASPMMVDVRILAAHPILFVKRS